MGQFSILRISFSHGDAFPGLSPRLKLNFPAAYKLSHHSSFEGPSFGILNLYKQ